MGGWAIAQSPILGTTITIERLSKRGHESLLTYYGKVAPHLNEPLYMRLRLKCPVDILIEREERSSRTHGGVKASPCQHLLAGRVIRLAAGFLCPSSNCFLPFLNLTEFFIPF